MSDNLNLGDAVSRAVAATLTPAYVEAEVGKRVASLVAEAVDSALRRYSDTGKLIEEKVKDALRVNALDLPTYGEMISGILKVQIEARVSELVAGRLAADMEDLLGLAPKEVKLSEIAKQMIEDGSHGQDYGEAITCFVEHSDNGYAHIYLDETEVVERRNKYSCKHQLAVDKDGIVYSATIDGRSLKDTARFGRSFGIGQRLRAYVACGTKIILDEDDVVISVGGD